MKDKKPKVKPKLKINGLMDNDKIRFKQIPCTCSQDPKDIMHQFPLQPCVHCHGQYQEKCFFAEFNNLECFEVTTGKNFDKMRTVTEVNIVRDEKTHMIIAYHY